MTREHIGRVAVLIAEAIKWDVRGRSGLDGVWDTFDAEVEAEIRAAWIAKIEAVLVRETS